MPSMKLCELMLPAKMIAIGTSHTHKLGSDCAAGYSSTAPTANDASRCTLIRGSTGSGAWSSRQPTAATASRDNASTTTVPGDDVGWDRNASAGIAQNNTATTMPRPPPRGVGCVCERRCPGRSSRPRLRAYTRLAATMSTEMRNPHAAVTRIGTYSPMRARVTCAPRRMKVSSGRARSARSPVVLLVHHAVDGSDGAPVLAARALPVMRLRAEAATAAAVHRLPFHQLAGEIAQDQKVFARFPGGPVEGGINQRHQASHRRALAQLPGQEIQ